MAQYSKYAIECHICPHSLTIIMDTGDLTDDAVQAHLANLMMLHLEHVPDDKKPTPGEVKSWVKPIKPVGNTVPKAEPHPIAA